MLNFSFPKSSRLLFSKQFKFVEKNSKDFIGNFTRISFCKGRLDEIKMGITVSRRFGKSYQRNRFKRLVREAFRISQHHFPPPLLLTVKPLVNAKQATAGEILSDFLLFAQKQGTLTKKECATFVI